MIIKLSQTEKHASPFRQSSLRAQESDFKKNPNPKVYNHEISGQQR